MTTRSAAAVNTSVTLMRATIRKAGRSTRRPPPVTTAMTATSLTSASQGEPDVPGCDCGDISGSTASIGSTARSWKRRMLKAARPYCVFSWSRSASTCSTSGVEDRERPKPTTPAAMGGSPSHHTAAPRTRLQENTCSDPRPKTVRRMTHSRVGCSSSPMMKSSSTTPNSEACRMLDTSVMSRSPQGPITSPAARNPRIEDCFS